MSDSASELNSENEQNGVPPKSPKVVTLDGDKKEVVVEEGESVVIDVNATHLDLNHHKIGSLAAQELSKLTCIEGLFLRWNLIKKIENLDKLVTLRELELYDNQITKIEGLDTLVNLEVLDLSFNRITHIEGLDKLNNLEKLFISSNKISKIENVGHLKNLKLLELGDNKIRSLKKYNHTVFLYLQMQSDCVCSFLPDSNISQTKTTFGQWVIENLEGLESLESLYLGKNKITQIQNLSHFKKLKILSLQCNRLLKVENLEQLTELEELYLSENGIEKIENLTNNVKLTTLDLAQNKIKVIENISHLVDLEEFWLNSNEVSDWKWVDVLAENKRLATVYLEHNPIARDVVYRRKLKMAVPWLVQIDATLTK